MEAGNKDHGIINFLPSYRQNQMNYSRVLNYYDSVTSTTTYGIKFVESEKETYVIKGKPHVVKASQFLLINKGQEFCCEVKEKNIVHGYCLNLEEDLLQKVYCQMIHSDEFLIDNPQFARKEQLDFHEAVYLPADVFNQFLTKNISRIRLEKDISFIDSYSFYHEACYQLLLSQRFTQKQIQKIRASKNSTRKEIFYRLNIARDIIDADISQKLAISFLAKECGLSEFHFYRSFKEAFGISPHQYVMNKRMEQSMVLLREEKSLITDIAYRVGFNDVCSFTKCFKRHFKVSPGKVHLASQDD
jgi:AraC family transcriptional regulator